MALYREIDGPDGAPRLVLVHGFTQSGRCWGPIAADLARDHQLVRVDAPGHGRSGDDDLDLWAGAELLADAGGPAIYVGYSMGARLCLHLALARPALCRGLVLIGATPGLRDPDARADRARADRALADRLESAGLAPFLDEWLRGPLFATVPADRTDLEERLRGRPEGLAASLRAAGTGQQSPLWGRLPTILAPTLVVVGERDPKFRAIATEMVAAFGGPTTLATIAGAGHCAHLEDPRAFLEVLRPWLQSQR